MDCPTVPHSHKLPNRKYDYRQARNINDLISVEFIKSLKLKPRNLDTAFNRGIRVQRQFCQKIFISGVKELLLHCIETNRKFVSPAVPRFAIFIRDKMESNKKGILKRSVTYRNVDLFETDFKIYQFFLSSGATYEPSYHIRIGYTMYQKFVEMMNTGKAYQNLGIFSTKVLLDKLELQYPTVERPLIRKILNEGFYRMHECLIENQEIFIKSINQCVLFIVYHNLKARK